MSGSPPSAIARRADRHERLLLADTWAGEPVATGLEECLAAVNQRAVRLLLVPDDDLVPGFVCERCEALTTTADGCPDWGTASRAVPDLIDEMAVRTIEDGGRVAAVRDLPTTVAAQLRFPLTG